MTFFRIVLGIDAIVAAVVLYFFVIGLADGSVSDFNAGLWAAILAALAAIIGGGLALNANGHRRAATAVLLMLAVPGLLFAVFMLSIIVFPARWN